jgi:hypothetical protein
MSVLEPHRIASVLEHLRKTCPFVFGADFHEFKINSPISADRIEAFEQEHAISLPLEYRIFITQIGNGGAGPFYGFFPLGVVDENFGFRDWHANDGLVGNPSKPFQFSDEWNDISKMPSTDLAEQNEAEYDAQMAEFEKSYWNPDLLDGSIPICHEGCALRIWLVVTGPDVGKLWEDRRSEYEGIRPLLLKNGLQATFADWYNEWLQDCLDATNQ